MPCRRFCATSSQPKLRGSNSFRLNRDGEESYPGTSAAAPAPAPAPRSSGGGGDAVAAAAATESHIAVRGRYATAQKEIKQIKRVHGELYFRL